MVNLLTKTLDIWRFKLAPPARGMVNSPFNGFRALATYNPPIQDAWIIKKIQSITWIKMKDRKEINMEIIHEKE